MKHLLRYWWCALLLVLVVVPVLAQDGPGAGEGGIIIEPNLGGDIATSTPCSRQIRRPPMSSPACTPA